jgi:ankyrin repeat protein
MNQKPFPTPVEIIRYTAKAFDIKNSNKELDDKSSEIMHPKQINTLIDSAIQDPLDKYMGEHDSKQIAKILQKVIESYTQFVGNYGMSELNRKQVMEIFCKSAESIEVVKKVFDILYKNINYPLPNIISQSGESTMQITLDWLDENIDNWKGYYKNLSIENKNKITSWKKSKHLPTSSSITNIVNDKDADSLLKETDLPKIKFVLLLTRLVDFIKKDTNGANIFALTDKKSFQEDSVELIRKSRKAFAECSHIFNNVFNVLYKQENKTKQDKEDALRDIKILKKYCKNDPLKGMQFSMYRLHALWNVFSGDLKEANKLYKKSFEKAIFIAGPTLKRLINEALMVASSLDKPDKVFIKKLRFAQILFHYDVESIIEGDTIKNADSVIDDSDIERYKVGFNRIFAKERFFDGCSATLKNPAQIGHISMSDRIKPDYSNPSKQITAGNPPKKQSQLSWLITQYNYEAVKKLINKKADVNSLSSSLDSPITMALQKIAVFHYGIVNEPKVRDDFYKLIVEQKHTKKTINQATLKRKITPFIFAVQTGRPDVVEKLLSMGADVNQRALTENTTPLMLCIRCVDVIKNPLKSMQDFKHDTPEKISSFRANSCGAYGMSLEENKAFLESLKHNPEVQRMQNKHIEIIQKYTDVDKIRECVRILIKAGANVNAQDYTGLKGYTPLMLVAEINDDELFQLMLDNGGDLNKTYTDPRNGKEVGLIEIVDYFNAPDVKKIIEANK